MLYEVITVKDITEPTYSNLIALASRFSDGMVQGSPVLNEAALEAIKRSGKPLLQYQSTDDYIENYSKFYDQIINA